MRNLVDILFNKAVIYSFSFKSQKIKYDKTDSAKIKRDWHGNGEPASLVFTVVQLPGTRLTENFVYNCHRRMPLTALWHVTELDILTALGYSWKMGVGITDLLRNSLLEISSNFSGQAVTNFRQRLTWFFTWSRFSAAFKYLIFKNRIALARSSSRFSRVQIISPTFRKKIYGNIVLERGVRFCFEKKQIRWKINSHLTGTSEVMDRKSNH